jgi:hypothetical protein
LTILCGFSPTHDPGDAPDFRRGYILAGAILAAILAVEIIASVWLW